MVSLNKRGEIWYLQFRVEGRQIRTSLKTKNRKLAEEIRLRKEVELAQVRMGLPRAAEPEPEPPALAVERALSEYESWCGAHKRPKTIKNDLSRLRALFASIEASNLRAITTAEVERSLVGRSLAGNGPVTMLRYREIAHAFWRWAVRQGYAAQNVVAPIPRPRLPEREPVYLTKPQIDELLKVVSDSQVEAVVATALFAGLRRAELCWLTWSDVELDGAPPLLKVRAKTVGGESWQPKTKRDRRVPISERLRTILVQHRRRASPGRVPWVFASPTGCRWDEDNLGRTVRAVLRGAGLRWNLLELRHTFGSQLALKGVSLLKIAKLMGNSPAIANKHYISLVPEELADDVAF